MESIQLALNYSSIRPKAEHMGKMFPVCLWQHPYGISVHDPDTLGPGKGSS